MWLRVEEGRRFHVDPGPSLTQNILFRELRIVAQYAVINPLPS